MEKNKLYKKYISEFVLAFAGCLGIIGIVANGGSSISYTNSFFAFVFFLMAYVVVDKAFIYVAEFKKRDLIYASVFSLIVSIALHFGARLEAYDNVNLSDISLYVYIICFATYLAPLVCALFKFIPDNISKLLKKNEKPFKFWQVWLVIFLLWIPTFLAMFPGAFVYDATDEYIEVISRNFTMHHPLVHVLLLGGMTHLAEYLGMSANVGIAVYTLLQMAVLSLCFSVMIVKLQKWGVSKKYLGIWIGIIGLFPVYPLYAVCSAKDTYFTGAMLIVIVYIIDFLKEKDRFFDKRMIIFIIASAAMMLLRNNGVYAYVITIPFVILIGKLTKQNMKLFCKFAILMVVAFIMYKGINLSLKIATHATDNEHQEMLTVPIQQLGRVYNYAPETFTEGELECLYEVLPENYLITYNPRCSDVLKSGFDNQAYSQNSSKYRKLWIDILKKKPLIYVNAWLVNSYGYWYPDMVINVYKGNQLYTFKYENSSYFGFETEPPGERRSMFPIYESFYRNISLELFQHKVPVISMLFAPGFWFVIYAFVFISQIRDKKWLNILVLMPILLLWLTVLLGPTILVRYVLIFWFAAPMLCLLEEKE